MAKWNLRVYSFTDGSTTFTASAAQGVYVEEGSAYSERVVDRIVVLPSGALHDLDGSDDAVLVYPKVWNAFVFSGANPGAHTQYSNLEALVGIQGTLTVGVPSTSTIDYWTATARLLDIPEDATWRAPFRTGAKNWLMIRGIWQLKSGLSLVV